MATSPQLSLHPGPAHAIQSVKGHRLGFCLALSYISILIFYRFPPNFRHTEVFLVSKIHHELHHFRTCECLSPFAHIALCPLLMTHVSPNSLFLFVIILDSASGRMLSLSPSVFVRCSYLCSNSILRIPHSTGQTVGQ